MSLLTMLIAAAGFAGLVVWQDARLAQATAAGRLDTVQQAQQLVEAQQARDLVSRARLIAGNQAVVGYVVQALGGALPGMEVDRKSIVDLLEEKRGQLGLSVAAVLDGGGKLVATTERFSDTRDFSAHPLFAAARKSQSPQTGVLVDGTRLLHVAIVPLSLDAMGESYLLAALPMGADFARTIAQVGATDVALLATTPEGRVVTASTLAPAQQSALLAALPAASLDGTALQRMSVEMAGSGRQVSIAPILHADGAHLVAVVQPPRDASTVMALRLPMLAGGLVTLLALAAGLYLVWHRLLAPAAGLAVVMERAADTGDTHLTARSSGSVAIGRLADAFNRLMARG